MDKITQALQKTFDGYTIKDYIRLIIIIGAYVMFRHQYVLWRGRRYNNQQQEMDEKLKREAEEEALNEAKEKQLGPSAEKAAAAAAASSAEWGWGNTAKTKLTKRRKYQESLARRQAEMEQVDDSDEEIADLLQN